MLIPSHLHQYRVLMEAIAYIRETYRLLEEHVIDKKGQIDDIDILMISTRLLKVEKMFEDNPRLEAAVFQIIDVERINMLTAFFNRIIIENEEEHKNDCCTIC